MSERQIAGVEIPGEVWAYARLFDVEDHLPAVLETVQRTFPGAAITFALEQPLPALSFHRLVVHVRAREGCEQQVLDARDEYYQAMLALLGEDASRFKLEWEERQAGEAEPMALEKPATVPAAVWRFATKWRVAKQLLAVLEMTQRVFPGCEPALVLENDPELAGDRYIIVRVSDNELDVSEGLKARRAWCEGLASACPGLASYLFRLRLELRP
jgi:hypothetical protein